eukprot:3769362-Pleurochrysis_carterae.AAC.1
MAGSSESTLSQGWNGWSGSEDFPMRRACVSPRACSAWFMTPLQGKAEEGARAAQSADTFAASTMSGVVVANDS